MLSKLREMIDAEIEHDDINDIMLEAVNNDIADMFIEDDGEADIADDALNAILGKIPEYDEEKELNKKLDRIAEAYIPEDDLYSINEGVFKEKKVVDVEVMWGGGEVIICALLEPDDYDDSGFLGKIEVKTPERFLNPVDNKTGKERKKTSDQDLLNYVKKNIKGQVSKKGFKIGKVFLH